ncbi:MAG TPA: MlaD family protein [Burkholderiaceae bacterium]|jgi:phospholipid/cholesterol/gamma-HCH transport system substrate-binding protein|nr:MlaD family protein [Burkholderiaceae bacterium]
MENKAHALIAGIFTLALLTAAVLIGLWFNRDRVERVPYQLATKLSVPGLSPQAAVRYRGLDVGRVDEITFDPTVPGQILVHISVRPDTPITKSTYATLGYQGVTGIAYVQLNDDGTNPVKLTSSKNQIARIEMRPSLLDNLESKGLAILSQAEELARRANTLLQPANQKAILTAFDNVSKAATEIEAIPRQMQPTLAKLPKLAAEAQAILASVAKLSKDVNALTTQLQAPDGPIAKIGSAADRVGSVAEKIELEALPLADDARSSLRAINRTLDSLNQRPQSILFGSPSLTPGPGETGFTAPAE